MPESTQSENSQQSSMAPSHGTVVSLPTAPRATVRGGNPGNENASASSIGNNLASSSSSNLTQRKNRLNTVKYYDIASNILAGGPDFDELFLAAVKDGEYDKIEHFLQGRSDIIISIDNKDKRTGNTPLIWAAKKNHTKIVQLLLKHGADPTLRNYEGQTAVEVAPPAIKTILLDSVEKTTESSHRLLLQAAWQGNIKIVRKLLRENKVLDINCQNAEGLTPLLLVTRDIQLYEKLSLQLNRPYNPVEVIQELLGNRANIHASDGDEKTCLHYASNSRATVAQSLVDVLIREGSELELRDKRHFMPIHWASHSGNTKVVVALIDGGSEVNSRGFAGLTPLHITAHNDHNKTAAALLERGADVTVTDDRGLTAVDLAKSRRMKTTLKEAWTEQTQKKQTPTLAPVRAPSREESRMAVEDSGRRRKGEVIFDGLVTTPQPIKTGTGSRPSFSRSISNADKARLAEQQMMKDLESGRFTPTIKENTRRLGTLRGSLKPTTLPRVGTASSGTPISPDRLSPESPSGRKSSLGDLDVRVSLEDGRGQLGVRRSKSLKLSQAAGERRHITPLSTREGTQEDFCVQNNRVSPVPQGVNPRMKTHRRTGSDPFVPPRLGDVAMSCDTYLPRRGRSLSNSEEYDLDERMRMTPLRTPLDREMTGLNIPTTIPEILTPRSTSGTVTVNMETKHQTTPPPQLISLYPNSSNVLPPTPTFVTQKSYSILDGQLVNCCKDGDSSKECSPRSDEDLPRSSRDQVSLALGNPTELLRSRSLLKEEFVLDESRPKDPLQQSSGSDPTSSASSLSSSPRDNNINILILNKVGKSAKEYHSPLSKVGRYSISGPNNNVGEKFRNKVGRSRSFSSGPCMPASSDKLSGVKCVGDSLKKPVQKQSSLDTVSPKDENSNAGKDLSVSPADQNMTRASVVCRNTKAKGNDVPNANIGSGKNEPSRPSATNNASTKPSDSGKQGCDKKTTTSQTMKKSQSSPSALNVPEMVRNIKTPQQNTSKVTATTSAMKSISANSTSTKGLSGKKEQVSPSSVSVAACADGESVHAQASCNTVSASVNKSVSCVKPSQSVSQSNPLHKASETAAVTTVTVTQTASKSRPVMSSTIKATTLQPKPSTQKPNMTSAKPPGSPTKSVCASTSVSLSKVSVKVPAAVPTQTASASASNIATDPNDAVPSASPQLNPTSAKQTLKVSFASQSKAGSASNKPVNILTPSKVPKSESPNKSLRSPSDSQLGSRPSSRQKTKPVRKSDTWRYVKPCQENKEPLVRISLPGEEPKPRICEPGVGSCVVMQTPVIVNPFENWIQPEIVITSGTLNEENARTDQSKGVSASSFGYVIGKSSKDATCKIRKNRNVKSAKKTKDGKRPVSGGQRQSSGRRRGAKSQDSKASESTENNGRVKSGKTGKRLKSARKKKKDLESEELRANADKPDVALISGIGWHLATGCNDTSDVKVANLLYSSDSDDSDIEIIDPEAPKFKLLSARTEGTVSPSTPRFQEIKGVSDGKLPLPVMTHDGFPPMNLDMTQEVSPDAKISESAFFGDQEADDEDYSNHLNDLTNALHKEIMLGKLTPIPEAPSVSCSVQTAINRFDQIVKDEQLNKMLGIIPGESLSSQQAEAIRQTRQDAGSSGDSRLRKSGSLRREILTNESAKAKAKVAASKANVSPESVSGKKNPAKSAAKGKPSSSKNSALNVKGGKDSLSAVLDEPKRALIKEKEKPKENVSNDYEDDYKNSGRERKFSETKKDEEEIDEAIEEIMNATGNSLSSTLRSNNTIRSLNSTLTEGDRNVLRKLHNNDSVFHAKTSDPDDVPQSDSYANDTNPNLLRVFHAENFNIGSKVKAMIDAGAEPSKVKAMLDADEEAKHLAKVMNSFRNMELHAGGGTGPKETPRKHHSVPRPEASSEGPLMTRKPPSGRPSSAGGRHKGKFLEMKSITPRNPEVEESIVQDEMAVLEKLSAAAEIPDPYNNAMMSNASDGETLCSRLSGRRGSRTGSACTEDSLSSIAEETIQWKKGNVLGKGAFGTVWCGLTNEGELIAVKQIDLNTTDMDKAHREYEKVQEEVELLKNLRHKNIVGYMGTSFEDYTVSIFMQFVPGGSIASILARFGALEESVFRRYTRQILEGVEYLHENDVIHRDIKGGNVMLMPNGIIKLIDFGCAKRLCINLSMSQSQILKSMKGTPYWMAPEVVNETGHGKKSDIWSIGCTVFEMATRKPPWADMNPMAAIFAIGSDKPVPTLPSDNFTPEAQMFVNRCLTRDQNVRPSATELLQDPFILKKSSKK